GAKEDIFGFDDFNRCFVAMYDNFVGIPGLYDNPLVEVSRINVNGVGFFFLPFFKERLAEALIRNFI
ncbi:MAG: hypothetical protein JXR76_20820, partial [Deltaproteobacteria bacterium]|nr:hypothetical protein [Deltaproteobacteria bacterium]